MSYSYLAGCTWISTYMLSTAIPAPVQKMYHTNIRYYLCTHCDCTNSVLRWVDCIYFPQVKVVLVLLSNWIFNGIRKEGLDIGGLTYFLRFPHWGHLNWDHRSSFSCNGVENETEPQCLYNAEGAFCISWCGLTTWTHARHHVIHAKWRRGPGDLTAKLRRRSTFFNQMGLVPLS